MRARSIRARKAALRRGKHAGAAPLLLLCLVPAVLTGAPPRPHAKARVAPPVTKERRATSDLEKVQAEIARVTRQVTADQIQRDRLERELQQAEGTVEQARQSLEGVRQERAVGAQRRSLLEDQREDKEADLDQAREELARQLRAAYVIEGAEPLKLLLNQQDPARAGRLFVYYSYFGRERARDIARIEVGVQALAKVSGQLAAEDAKLAGLEKQHRERLAGLEQARARRKRVIDDLAAESRSSEKRLARLRAQQAGLEQLLAQLRPAMERLDRLPADTHSAFAQLRGKLAWPVAGRSLLARYGEPRAGGIKWDGLLLSTEAGEPVHAVYGGRVVYADWLPGLGLLSIVDHGDGYMSLYGHNQQLYKAVGEEVKAGEAIAAAGDSGGSNRPELYFEIRKGGKPIDPQPWFRP